MKEGKGIDKLAAILVAVACSIPSGTTPQTRAAVGDSVQR